MEKLPSRLPPSENSEWREIGDESRGDIPYYHHTTGKTGETVWEKPDGFVIPLTVLQVRPFTVLDSHRLKLPPTRTPPWVIVSSKSFSTSTNQHRLCATAQERRPATQRSRSCSKIEATLMLTLPLLAGFSPLQVVPLPPPRKPKYQRPSCST